MCLWLRRLGTKNGYVPQPHPLFLLRLLFQSNNKEKKQKLVINRVSWRLNGDQKCHAHLATYTYMKIISNGRIYFDIYGGFVRVKVTMFIRFIRNIILLQLTWNYVRQIVLENLNMSRKQKFMVSRCSFVLNIGFMAQRIEQIMHVRSINVSVILISLSLLIRCCVTSSMDFSSRSESRKVGEHLPHLLSEPTLNRSRMHI